MTEELFCALAIALMLPLNAVAGGTAKALAAGFGWGLGNRDTAAEMPAWAKRINRAHANLVENAASFIGVVLIAHVLGVHDHITVIGAWGFLCARIFFYFAYVFGVTFLAVRTIAYFVSLTGLFAITVRVLQSG